MLNWRHKIIRLAYIITDIIFIVLGIQFSKYHYSVILGYTYPLNKLEQFGFMSLSVCVLVVLMSILKAYHNILLDYKKVKLKTSLKVVLVILFSILLIRTIMNFYFIILPNAFYIYYGINLVLFIFLKRILFSFSYYNDDDINRKVRNILVVGYSHKGEKYIQEIKKHDYLDFNIVGYIHIGHEHHYEGIKFLGDIQDLDTIIQRHVIDEIVMAKSVNSHEYFDDAIQRFLNMGITITVLLEFKKMYICKSHVEMVGDMPSLKLHSVSLNETQMFLKRLMDIVFGLVGFVIFALFYIIIGPIIKLESKGPILFKQKRVGRNGRIFDFWKFRSMHANAERMKAELEKYNEMNGHMFKMSNDPRVTKVGAFIRKTSIDEFPQFYNVLKGDMSIVGTRPPTVDEVQKYNPNERMRIAITPGITGKWQVSGRSQITDFEEVLKMDSEYITNWSILLDLKIILKTVVVVFSRKGSY